MVLFNVGLTIVFLMFFLVFSKEFLILNEEFLLICSFSIFFFNAYKTIGGLLDVSLKTRADEIAASFITIYEKKKANVVQFQKILKKYPELLTIISTVYQYSEVINTHMNTTWDVTMKNFTNYLVETKLNAFFKEEIRIFRLYYATSIYLMFDNILKLSKQVLIESETDVVKDIINKL